MYSIKTNEEIGEYLKDLITHKYPNVRQFCKAYLTITHDDNSDDGIRKLHNRFSQILKGTKGIQTKDLPVVAELLDVSYEEILSCEKPLLPIGKRLTNYDVARSNDQALWETYATRSDNLILNCDEYCKSVLDYIFEFKNYGFLKHLIDKGYIWFADGTESGFCFFGAGTSIKRRSPCETDSFVPSQIMNEDWLRTHAAALAIENNDLIVLDTLHAREIPALLYSNAWYYTENDLRDVKKQRDAWLVQAVAASGTEILDYFSTEFQVQNMYRQINTFLFPYLGDVIGQMLKAGRTEVELLLRRALSHNKKTYEKMDELVQKALSDESEILPDYPEISPADRKENETIRLKRVLERYRFEAENGIIAFGYCISKQERLRYVTNIIHVSAVSENPLLNELITEINDWYSKISQYDKEIQ